MGAGADTQYEQAAGELPAGSVSNAELATMAAGTVKGRQGDSGAGPPVDLTGAEQGENLRLATVQSESGALPLAITLNADTTFLSIVTAGAGEIRTITGSTLGRVVLCMLFGTGTKTFRHNFSVGTSSALICPGLVDFQLGVRDAFFLVGLGADGWEVVSIPRATPTTLAVLASSLAVPFQVYVNCPSGGAAGTADDVTVWNANAPFAMRILDATMRVSTAVALATATLRTASGGGGSGVLLDAATGTSTFSNATTGPHDDTAVATATVAANGSLFLRRSDRSVVGELILTCIRT